MFGYVFQSNGEKRRNERVSTLRRVEKKEMESIGEGCKRTMKSNDKILTKIN